MVSPQIQRSRMLKLMLFMFLMVTRTLKRMKLSSSPSKKLWRLQGLRLRLTDIARLWPFGCHFCAMVRGSFPPAYPRVGVSPSWLARRRLPRPKCSKLGKPLGLQSGTGSPVLRVRSASAPPRHVAPSAAPRRACGPNSTSTIPATSRGMRVGLWSLQV